MHCDRMNEYATIVVDISLLERKIELMAFPLILLLVNFLQSHAVIIVCGKRKGKIIWNCQSHLNDLDNL